MRLSEHYTLEQLTDSYLAIRYGLDNHPPLTAIENLKKVAALLEVVRTLVDARIHIISGYRCPVLNTMVGGAIDSPHLTGCAVDFEAKDFGSAFKVCSRIYNSQLVYDELIHEYGRWAHLSISAAPRKLVWTKWYREPRQPGVNEFHGGLIRGKMESGPDDDV